MKKFFTKIRVFVVAHKALSSIIIIIIALVAWQIVKAKTSTDGEIRYVTANVEKGTIVSSITASGQVEALSQIDLKARTTGEITYVGVKAGEVVRKGRTLFSIDAKDAEKAVRNAQINLETAKLDLEKFKKEPDNVDVLTIKKAIADAEETKVDAAKAIKDAYKDLLNSSTIASPVDSSNTLTAPTVTGTYTKDIDAKLTITVYQAGSGSYFTVTSDPSGIVKSSPETINSLITQPVGDSGLYVKFAANTYTNQPSWIISLPNKSAPAYSDNAETYQNAIDNKNKTDATADLTVAQKNKSLNDLYQPDSLDLRTKELAVKQAQDNLLSAQADLSDYYVVAPFSGTISSVVGKVGDTASGTLATLITNQKVAAVSMNEVDVSKIKLGERVTVSFDAIPDLTLTGEVAEIDTVGTVSQGVVSYSVKISLDTNDDRVKTGMSLSAAIITNLKTDVLMVPSGAVKTQGAASYVQMFATPLESTTEITGTVSKIAPARIPVEIGISDDTNTEIISGIKEGDQIVSRTITSTTKTATTQAPSLLGGAGGRTGGGGNFGR